MSASTSAPGNRADATFIEEVRARVPLDRLVSRHTRLKRSGSALRGLEAEAAPIMLPSDLHLQTQAILQHEPAIPWDLAVAEIAEQVLRDAGGAQ